MARILVVDDERTYRRWLERLLVDEGHEVRVAESGREAIDVGARWRPDLAVVDWMLRGDLHGLHVAAALRAVRPDTRVILITGFPSEDLRRSSDHLSDFVTKPFDLDQVRLSIAGALASEPPPPLRLQCGLIEVDGERNITYTNPRGLELAGGSSPARHLDDLFTGDARSLEQAADEWVGVSTRSGARWSLRSQPAAPDGSRLLVVCPSDAHHNVPLIDIVLGVAAPRVDRAWAGRVLVVDDDRFYRMTVAKLFDQLGVPCVSAGSHAQAVRLLEADPGLDLAVLDYDMPDGDVGELVGRIRAIRPGILLVGNSAGDRQHDFALRGVDLFLAKPWRTADLLDRIATARPAVPDEATRSPRADA
jgi:CheY-like chemotaxis protein